MRLKSAVLVIGVLAALGVVAKLSGALDPVVSKLEEKREERLAKKNATVEVLPPAVSAVPATVENFVETALVTGSLVPREEILVAPEVDGLRVLELKVDVGDRVKKGDVMATLVIEQLDAQLAQNDAAAARATAAIQQAKSQIADAEARRKEAEAQLERAKPLAKDRFLSQSVLDQRQAAASSAVAQLASANSGLRSAEAELAQIDAQRRELNWRRGNTDIRAPRDGIVSRRSARVGSIAQGGAMGGQEPMFRIISDGEVELDAEVSETRLSKIKPDQKARVEVAGAGEVEGKVRLVSPEVDPATRLGRVRIFLGDNTALRIGAFARGVIETDTARAIAIPRSAILYGEAGASVQVIENDKIATRQIKTGLEAGGLVEVKSGLKAGEVVVSKSGTFLRDGDAVRPILPQSKVSEADK